MRHEWMVSPVKDLFDQSVVAIAGSLESMEQKVVFLRNVYNTMLLYIIIDLTTAVYRWI